MPAKQQCGYFVLRYVPDAVKNEFVNIGVVLLPPSGPPELRFTRDWSRVRCLDPQADIELLQEIETELELRILATGMDRDFTLRAMRDSFSNTLQLSDMSACLAESPEAEADKLARLYLESTHSAPPRETSTRQTILRKMKGEFHRVGAWDFMAKGIAASQYTRKGDPLKIDCGYSTTSAIKMFHALPIKADAEAAKALAFSFPQLEEGIWSMENARVTLTAIVEDGLDSKEDAIGFALETLQQKTIAVVAVSRMPEIAIAVANELGLR